MSTDEVVKELPTITKEEVAEELAKNVSPADVEKAKNIFAHNLPMGETITKIKESTLSNDAKTYFRLLIDPEEYMRTTRKNNMYRTQYNKLLKEQSSSTFKTIFPNKADHERALDIYFDWLGDTSKSLTTRLRNSGVNVNESVKDNVIVKLLQDISSTTKNKSGETLTTLRIKALALDVRRNMFDPKSSANELSKLYDETVDAIRKVESSTNDM